ncbi:uncharacterized protein BO97DRAFT_403992 [Aspergillus homomorphus CBS 101889]|uniref:Uncharacterized protein n=1 Tax=Aspergillus homomorphus (strain CBS 101889) TaxID=1450537 RepID=A0A395I6A1_ASPHC|nr:hypothetical protein BO97DRAFT_403992 [Aspergillus homomorphus CBS 101889]RAL14973.1 hypothetical protein BO97DRAFT_403992 [Aspergillus homomorphus CBS 101889]
MFSSCLARRCSRLAGQTSSQRFLFAHIPSGKMYISSTANRLADNTKDKSTSKTQTNENTSAQKTSTPSKTKSVSQADQELRERLEQMSGDGGASGIEYEDGKPTAMKRSVRNNMFRYI